MKYFIAVYFILLCLRVTAQQKYDVSLIPKELLPYASAVVREDEVTCEIKNFDYSNYHIKRAVTILNESGEKAARVFIWYDKITSVRAVKGIVYDEAGWPVGKFSEKSFGDYYAGNDFSLFEDTRVKFFSPAAVKYPYTIAYEYDIRTNQTMNINDWVPAKQTGIAIEKSVYTFSCIPAFTIRYKELNLPSKVVTGTNTDKLVTYKWEINNLKAIRYEPYSPPDDNFLPMVKIAPVNFKYQNISGAFSNWNEMGKWVYDKLLTGQGTIDPVTVAYIKNITAAVTDPKLKAKKIYEYMQQKTRYISVQVGIGGYRPYPAADVDRLNYGDCKALVNYTQALLKAADIESYYCVVEAGSEKISLDPDFASMSQGNHIILCLPFKNDTTFLECTDQKAPFGFMGDFTDDRIVLACTAQGGKLLHTPKYITADNLQQRTATLDIDAEGLLKGTIQTTYKGTQYDNREAIVRELPAERIKEYKKIYPINNLEIEKLELVQDKGLQPITKEQITFNAYDYASVNNGKLYFLPNIVNRRSAPLREVKNRKNMVFINRGYTDEDEIVYNIPAGYKTEKMPLNVSVDKPFAKYTATVTLKDNRLIYKRSIQLIEGIYSKDTYPQLVEFYQDVLDADQYSVILSKGNN
ncbi:MAG: DUF3857 domain-containing protein [Mucilaginibacter sp.]